MPNDPNPNPNPSGPQWKDVPIDWEALEDAFENNAPEVHSYLHVPTGDVLRIVDGVADPQMHARIAADNSYLRVEPVPSREQYRWMERYIPMVTTEDLQQRLTHAIDGKGAFRRFKDVLMGFAPERERWFAFRSERLRIHMEAWLNAHAITPVKRTVWTPDPAEEAASDGESLSQHGTDTLRNQLRELIDGLGHHELEQLAAFGEFLRIRRSARPSAPSAPRSVTKSEESAPNASSSGSPTSSASMRAAEG